MLILGAFGQHLGSRRRHVPRGGFVLRAWGDKRRVIGETLKGLSGIVGKDNQLDRAIEEVVGQLAKDPQNLPPRPPDPDETK